MSEGVLMSEVVDIVLLILLAVTGLAVIRARNLFAAVMLTGIYSLVSAVLFVVMDAVDVAFTEAAVGAGISTVLMLGTLALVGYKEAEPAHKPILPLFVVLVTGGILVYGTSEIPPFGNPDNPANHHVAPSLHRGVRARGGTHPQRRHVRARLVPGLRHDGRDRGRSSPRWWVCSCCSRGARCPSASSTRGNGSHVRPGETREELEEEILRPEAR